MKKPNALLLIAGVVITASAIGYYSTNRANADTTSSSLTGGNNPVLSQKFVSALKVKENEFFQLSDQTDENLKLLQTQKIAFSTFKERESELQSQLKRKVQELSHSQSNPNEAQALRELVTLLQFDYQETVKRDNAVLPDGEVVKSQLIEVNFSTLQLASKLADWNNKYGT